MPFPSQRMVGLRHQGQGQLKKVFIFQRRIAGIVIVVRNDGQVRFTAFDDLLDVIDIGHLDIDVYARMVGGELLNGRGEVIAEEILSRCHGDVLRQLRATLAKQGQKRIESFDMRPH